MIDAYGARGNRNRTEPDADSALAPEGDLGMQGKNLYLLACGASGWWTFPALKQAVRKKHSLFDATEALIEDKAS